MGGKAGPKRVVQLRVKWGENRGSRGKAASTSGFAARNHKSHQLRRLFACLLPKDVVVGLFDYESKGSMYF